MSTRAGIPKNVSQSAALGGFLRFTLTVPDVFLSPANYVSEHDRNEIRVPTYYPYVLKPWKHIGYVMWSGRPCGNVEKHNLLDS